MMSTPKIHEDGYVNDFSAKSRYRVKVSYTAGIAGYVHIDNSLSGLECLTDAIDNEDAAWTSEIVVPRALLSHRKEGDKEGRVEFDWNANYEHHPTYVRSSLVAKRDFYVPKRFLSVAWRQMPNLPSNIPIPQGSVICRSQVKAISGKTSQFLAFKQDDGTLPKTGRKPQPGLMKVVDSGKDPVMFYAIVSDDLYQTRETDRNLWVSALSRALTMISREENSWNDPKYTGIKQTLETQLGRTLQPWNDQEFDPLLAATQWEPFHPSVKGETDVEDN